MIRVSVGIITQGTHVLICQRRGQDLHALKWEFPGGKAQDTEDDATCLQRELQEELQITAMIGEQLHETVHHYPNGRSVALTFLHVPSYTGEVVNTQFHALLWAKPTRLPEYDFLEGDLDFVARLARGDWPQLFRTLNPEPRTPNFP
ncbi:MAG: NUDIX domain-containing protein [Deltaproteobacteria bacterium]|nr:NUDIX domain-containing protein [Deltaproteobacteria bacterium]